MKPAARPENAVEPAAAPEPLTPEQGDPAEQTASELATHWLRLACTPGIGPINGRQLATACGGVAAVWQSGPEQLLNIDGIGERAIKALAASGAGQAEAIIRQCREQGIHILCIEDEAYPPMLRQTADAPLVLFAHGRIRVLKQARMLAVVGSRKADSEGKLITRRWCAHLAAQGIGIVSGMAYGIDAAAHGGALDAGEKGAPTIAVLGCGLASQLSPVQHKQIAAIAQRGCVISEFLPDEQARPGSFPQRNRIIAGLSAATLVVQADIKSGSLITARLAGEYGREVLAVPGSTLAGRHAGCHQLLRDGATLVESTDDILASLNWQAGPGKPRVDYVPADDREAEILQALDGTILHIDALAEDCGLTVSELSPILLGLELLGVVDALPGSRYTMGRSG